jgi:hypothetical protein
MFYTGAVALLSLYLLRFAPLATVKGKPSYVYTNTTYVNLTLTPTFSISPTPVPARTYYISYSNTALAKPTVNYSLGRIRELYLKHEALKNEADKNSLIMKHLCSCEDNDSSPSSTLAFVPLLSMIIYLYVLCSVRQL